MGIRISETQIRLLRELPLRKLVIAFDNDEAGELGKKKLKEKLGMEKLLYAIQFPEGVKDVNDMTDEQISNHEITLF